MVHDMLDILTSHEKAAGWNQQWHASHTVKINEKWSPSGFNVSMLQLFWTCLQGIWLRCFWAHVHGPSGKAERGILAKLNWAITCGSFGFWPEIFNNPILVLWKDASGWWDLGKILFLYPMMKLSEFEFIINGEFCKQG